MESETSSHNSGNKTQRAKTIEKMHESSPNLVSELEDLNVPTLMDYSSRPVRGISAATTFF